MRFARHPEVLWRSTSQGPVILVPGRDDPDRLGGLAAVVWEVLDEPLDAERLLDELTTVLGHRPELTSCLETLLEAGLLEAQPGP